MPTTHFVDVHVLARPEQSAAVRQALLTALKSSNDAEGVVRPAATARKPWPADTGLVSMFFTQDGKSSLSSKDLVKAFEVAVHQEVPDALVLSVGFCLDEPRVWCRHPGKDGAKTLVEANPKVLESLLEGDWYSVVASMHVDAISTAMLPHFLEAKPVRKALERAGFEAPSPKVQAKRLAAAVL